MNIRIEFDNEVLQNLFFDKDGGQVITQLTIELDIDQPNIDEKLNVVVYPNPSNDRFTFEVELKQSTEINIEIYDLFGNVISQRIETNHGIQSFTFNNISKLADGVIFYKVETNNFVKHGKLMKIK